MRNVRALVLDNSRRMHVEGLRDLRWVRRKLEDDEIVGHKEANHVNRHVPHMTVENNDVWLSVNLAVVDEPLVKLAGTF